MASIRERARADGSISYEVLFRLDGKQRSETFNNAKAQLRFKANVERLGAREALGVLDAHATNDQTPLLGDAMRDHIETLSGITAGTRDKYLWIVRRMENAGTLTHLPVDTITEKMIAKWVTALADEGLASKSIKDQHSLVSATLSRQVKEGNVRYNFAKGVKIAESVKAEIEFLTPPEFAELEAVAPPEYRSFLRFLFGTGARFNEVAALQKKDLRLLESPATVSITRSWKYASSKGWHLGPPKTKRARRTISLPNDLLPELEELSKGKKPDDILFLNMAGGVIRNGTFNESFRAWVKKSGVGKHVTPHDLRHSHASWMIAQGMNLMDLQYRLGHESITTTANTYGHMMPEAQAQAARHANNMFAQRWENSGPDLSGTRARAIEGK